MKKNIMIVLGAVALAAGCATREVREVRVATLDELPFAVQQTIREEAPYADIAKVEREIYSGRPIYEVSFHDPISNPHLSIAEDGVLLSGGTRIIHDEAGAALVTPTVGTRFEDLPVAVQNAIRLYAPTSRIADIDKEVRPDGTVYEVQFAEPGRNPRLYIREDGILLDRE